jgi:hypothetical protein
MTCHRGASNDRFGVSGVLWPRGSYCVQNHRAPAANSRWLRGLGRRSHDQDALDLPLHAQFELAQIGFEFGAQQSYVRFCRDVVMKELVDLDGDLFGDTAINAGFLAMACAKLSRSAMQRMP